MIYIQYYPLMIAKDLITAPQKYCTNCRVNYETGLLFYIRYPAGKKIVCIKCLGVVMKTLLLRYQNYDPLKQKKTPCECPTCNIEHGQSKMPQTYVDQMRKRHDTIRKGEI